MAYYEACAHMISNDRELIIRMGFREWLLASINDRAGPTETMSRKILFAPLLGRKEPDIVILMANLLGGV